MKPTASQINTLRTRPHVTKLHLSIYRPQTVLACRSADSPEREDRVITYNTVTVGSYTGVESGMTLWVGTSAGGQELGRVRVRSATATTITVAENSDINWANDLYLTVVRFFEIWPVFPRLVQDAEDVTFYKDYDIAYNVADANENENLGLFINMGPHGMALLGPANTPATIYYSASGTSSLMDRVPLTYDWAFEGGTPTGSTSNTPGNVTYSTPGHYTTRLKVTDASGTYDTSYRHISIYNRPEYGTNTPVLKWGLESLSGSRDEGGYTASLWIRDTVDYLVDGMLVVIHAEDWYGATETSIGGNALGRSGTVFTGYIVAGSIRYDYRDSIVTFEVRSPTGIMEMMEGFSVSVESRRSPEYWYELKEMTVKRALYHYLRWHTTVLLTNDIEYVGIDPQIQYFDADRTSLYDAAQTLMDGTVLGGMVCDRQGKVWAEVDVSALASGTSSLQTSLSLTNVDWMNEPSFEERSMGEVSYLETGGIQYNIFLPKNAGRTVALMASAPGTAPAYRGSVERRQGFALMSQNQLNAMTGNLYAYRNVRFPEVSLDLAGNYRNFDIAPQEITKLTLAATDTPRGLVWSEKAFAVRGMEWGFDARLGLFLPTMRVTEVPSGMDALTVAVVEPPDDGHDQPPTPPVPPIPPAPSTGGGGQVWVPVIRGYNVGTAAFIEPYLYGYIIQPDSVISAAYGTLYIPTTVTSAVISVVVGGSGAIGGGGPWNIAGVNSLDQAENGDSTFTDTVTSSGLISIASGNSGPIEALPLILNSAGGKYLELYFSRVGNDGSDNYGAASRIYGWKVVYL